MPATPDLPICDPGQHGAIPGLVGRQDLLIVDEQAHNSIQEGAKIARANGVRVMTFSHCDPVGLEKVFRRPAIFVSGWWPSMVSTA